MLTQGFQMPTEVEEFHKEQGKNRYEMDDLTSNRRASRDSCAMFCVGFGCVPDSEAWKDFNP